MRLFETIIEHYSNLLRGESLPTYYIVGEFKKDLFLAALWSANGYVERAAKLFCLNRTTSTMYIRQQPVIFDRYEMNLFVEMTKQGCYQKPEMRELLLESIKFKLENKFKIELRHK